MDYDNILLKVNLGTHVEPYISYISLADIKAMHLNNAGYNQLRVDGENVEFLFTGEDDKAKVLARWANVKRKERV